MSPSARTHRLINKFNKHCSSISQTVFRATRNSTVSKKKKKTNLWGSHASPKLKIHCSAKNLSCVVHKTQLSYSKKHTILHKRSLQKPEPKQKRKKKGHLKTREKRSQNRARSSAQEAEQKMRIGLRPADQTKAKLQKDVRMQW